MVEKLTVEEFHVNIHGHACSAGGDGEQAEQEDKRHAELLLLVHLKFPHLFWC